MKKLFLFFSSFWFIQTHAILDDYFFDFTNQRAREYIMRIGATLDSTLNQDNYDITAENSGHAAATNFYVSEHTKSLEHDPTTGLLTASGVANYQQLLAALNSTQQADYNAIQCAPGATMKFVNPQGGHAMSIEGIPNNLAPMPPFPDITTPQAAALLIEIYLQAFCRDVLFKDYGTGLGTDIDSINGGSITNNVAAILTALEQNYTGPKTGGIVSASLLFKCDNPGNVFGPYVSQFLYFPIPFGFQQSVTGSLLVNVAQNREFGVAWDDFIAIQNGSVPRPYVTDDFVGQRYIVSGRDLATLVHRDGPGEVFFYAANILIHNNFPHSPALPYFNGSIVNEVPFVTLSITDIYAALFGALFSSIKGAWAHKWRANRALRPEAFSGIVQNARDTGSNPFALDASLFANYTTPAGMINLLDWVKNYNTIQQTGAVHDPLSVPDAETYLLSLVYPEGAPGHPSYPSGHATVSGACITILKAFFDDQAFIHNHIQPVKPDPADTTALVDLPIAEGGQALTVGNELDKLAVNIAMGRNFAGLHYRNDAIEGILLGENIALNYLRERAHIYSEDDFTGFELTTFLGQRVRVTKNGITTI